MSAFARINAARPSRALDGLAAFILAAGINATRPSRALDGLVAFISAKVHLGDLGSISVFHDVLGSHRSTRVTTRGGVADTIRPRRKVNGGIVSYSRLTNQSVELKYAT